MTRKNYSVTSAEVMDGFVPVLTGPDDERTFRYVHPGSGRQFHVFRTLTIDYDFLFKLVEVSPSNLIAQFNKQGYCIAAKADERLDEIERSPGPNFFIEECQRLKINPEKIIFNQPGYSKDSISFESMESCAVEVARSVITNSRYIDVDLTPLSEDEARKEAASELEDSRQFWRGAKAAAVAAEDHSVGIFKGCHNMAGRPLSKSSRECILNYLNNPSQDLWNDVRSTIIAGSKTLWQAWVEIDKKANRSGSVGFPNAETLREAIRAGVQSNMDRIDERLEELKPAEKPKMRLV